MLSARITLVYETVFLPSTDINSSIKEKIVVSENELINTVLMSETNYVIILHKQLKKLLNDHDVTVAQLARATKISSKTLYQWLHGQKPRDLNQVLKVANYFEVTIDNLAFGIENTIKNELTEYKDEINAGVFEVILRKQRK